MKGIISSVEATAESNTRASYCNVHLVTTNLKPFTNSEFFKMCMMAVIKDMCPDKSSECEVISLSARILDPPHRRAGRQYLGTVKNMCQSTHFFSITLDKLTDIKDTAQLAIFFNSGRGDLVIFEEVIRLTPQ